MHMQSVTKLMQGTTTRFNSPPSISTPISSDTSRFVHFCASSEILLWDFLWNRWSSKNCPQVVSAKLIFLFIDLQNICSICSICSNYSFILYFYIKNIFLMEQIWNRSEQISPRSWMGGGRAGEGQVSPEFDMRKAAINNGPVSRAVHEFKPLSVELFARSRTGLTRFFSKVSAYTASPGEMRITIWEERPDKKRF